MQDQINAVSYPTVKGTGSLQGELMKRAFRVKSMRVKVPKLKNVGKLPKIGTRVHNNWKA